MSKVGATILWTIHTTIANSSTNKSRNISIKNKFDFKTKLFTVVKISLCLEIPDFNFELANNFLWAAYIRGFLLEYQEAHPDFEVRLNLLCIAAK